MGVDAAGGILIDLFGGVYRGGDFYKMPITVAFVISSIVAIAISKEAN